jgi:hypothetical protein
MRITGINPRVRATSIYFVRLLARRCRAASVIAVSFAMISASFVVVGCTPTFESHIDSPPAFDSPVAQQCPPVERPGLNTENMIAPLDPRPQLPDAEESPCPSDSGLYACFMLDQDLIRQKRFKILHDDREYCRDAYDKAVKRAAEVNR